MKTSEVLDRAADLIEERGWTAGPEGWETDQALCLEGGIMAALEIGSGPLERARLYRDCPAYNAVARHLELPEDPWKRSPGFDIEGFLWMWNDAKDRTDTEVVEVLRAAAVIEAARETPPRGIFRMGDIAVHIPAAVQS